MLRNASTIQIQDRTEENSVRLLIVIIEHFPKLYIEGSNPPKDIIIEVPNHNGLTILRFLLFLRGKGFV